MAVPAFPTLQGLTWPVKRTPIWSTVKQPAISGLESRFALWSYPKYRYELSFSKLRSDLTMLEFQTLMGFYNSVSGPAGLFTFTDVEDSIATTQLIGTGDGLNKNFQMVRSLGGFTEPVFYTPVATIFKNGVTQFSPADYVLNSGNGLLTFAAAPAVGASITWTGTFGWYCRFDDDQVDFRNFASKFWEAQELRFTTEKF